MSRLILVRNVPEALHRELVRRAEARGLTLTAYIQSVLERNVARMSREEVLRRVGAELIRMDRGPLPGDE